MGRRIVEIATQGLHLSAYRGFVRIENKEQEIGRVAFDDIGALVVRAHGITYTNDLVVRLAENNAPLVVCGSNFAPVAWLWPVAANNTQAQRMDAQIALKKSTRKQLWKQIVSAKIQGQIQVLEALGHDSQYLSRVLSSLRSGDTKNCEAVASARYWKVLMGDNFKRNRDEPGINAALNYGYIIVRSCIARAVMGAGLHPTIAIHHRNKYNAYRLVDDLLEPFRPIVDFQVKLFGANAYGEGLSREIKSQLVALLEHEIFAEEKSLTVAYAAERLANSYASVCLNEADSLFPIDGLNLPALLPHSQQ